MEKHKSDETVIPPALDDGAEITETAREKISVLFEKYDHIFEEDNLMENKINDTDPGCESEDEFFGKLREAYKTVRWKTAHQKLPLRESIREAGLQNDRMKRWVDEGGILTNLWMFINGEELCLNPLPRVRISEMPDMEEGSRLEFWHCNERNEKDFILFVYKIGPSLIECVTQKLSNAETLGINVRYKPEQNNYYVIVRTGAYEKVRREVLLQKKLDYQMMFCNANHDISWLQIAKGTAKRKIEKLKAKTKAAAAGLCRTFVDCKLPQIVTALVTIGVGTAALMYCYHPVPGTDDVTVIADDEQIDYSGRAVVPLNAAPGSPLKTAGTEQSAIQTASVNKNTSGSRNDKAGTNTQDATDEAYYAELLKSVVAPDTASPPELFSQINEEK